MIKHIIFDFDGTIANSSEIGIKILNQLSIKYKIRNISREEIFSINNLPIKERFKYLDIPIYKLPQIAYETLKLYKGLVHEITIFDGMDVLINQLKNEGYKLSIVSSNNVENITAFLKKYNLDCFDHILSSKNIFGKHKVLDKYIKNNRLQPEDILYIGDELRDIEACKKLGIKIVAVTWGFDSVELIKSANPEYIHNSPSDILQTLKKLQ